MTSIGAPLALCVREFFKVLPSFILPLSASKWKKRNTKQCSRVKRITKICQVKNIWGNFLSFDGQNTCITMRFYLRSEHRSPIECRFRKAGSLFVLYTTQVWLTTKNACNYVTGSDFTICRYPSPLSVYIIIWELRFPILATFRTTSNSNHREKQH